MTSAELQFQALSKAVNGPSLANYPAIFEGFMAKGIPESEIKPRENVFTFNAWKALGRFVRKGEHGVKIATVVQRTRRNKADGTEETFSMPWSTTVFHISQTEPIKSAEAFVQVAA
jgi:N-terminal domain of anti-restriction factor ArdC